MLCFHTLSHTLSRGANNGGHVRIANGGSVERIGSEMFACDLPLLANPLLGGALGGACVIDAGKFSE